MPRKTLVIPRFPEMTLRDAIELGTRRLQEDGYVEVRFDPASVTRATTPDGADGDWRLGFLVVDPDAGSAVSSV
ncbi:MAG: hypothetical protein ACJ76A_03485 [Actinomycetota bacterium]|jgi:hypothetical protein